jgi:hypothetical protein
LGVLRAAFPRAHERATTASDYLFARALGLTGEPELEFPIGSGDFVF